jgi:uncharacterized protein YdeI (YjbR/CyaY-like superfamily)
MGVVVNPDVDAHIERSEAWRAEMTGIRAILLGCGLEERLRWGKPCYAHDGRNVVILQQMKDFLALMFFKGALMDDPHGLLEEQGPNSRSARRIRVTGERDVDRLREVLPAYVREAVAVEERGLEAGPAPEPEPVPELRERLERDAALRAAFEGLTPGRRREYHLHLAGAKRAATRTARIEACAARILDGRGLRDR